MYHFLKCDPQWEGGLAVDEVGSAFGFRSRRHYVFDDFTGSVNGDVFFFGFIVVG